MSHALFSKRSLTYEQTLEQLYHMSLGRRKKRVNRNAPIIDRLLGNPAMAYPSIHVAGTNGKGSVTIKIAKALELSGLNVGLFTSPHLISFCERICINGELISQDAVTKGCEILFALVEKHHLKPTFFELVTNLACLYFKEQSIDIGVFEVGLCGRADATNIIEPILSVITSIGLDHSRILGDTLELIAEQKAGIIRPFVPVVLGPTVRYESVEAIAKEKNAPITYVEGAYESFEKENRAVAKVCLEKLKNTFKLSDQNIAMGLSAMPACRFQKMYYNEVPVIMDVAHNPTGMEKLLEALSIEFPGKMLQVIFALSNDKDHAGCLCQFSQRARAIYFPLINHYKLRPAQKLNASLKQLGIKTGVVLSTEEAVRVALESAKKHDDVIVVCGSFYLMEPVLSLLENNESSSLSLA